MLLIGILVGLVNGLLVVISRVPDIVVTLSMLFVWAGAALLVLGTPGGGSVDWLDDMIDGGFVVDFVPRAIVVLLVVVGIIWIPLRRSRLGLSLYAIGSNELAAFRSGVNVARTKAISYALTGLFAALGGLALTASTGIGAARFRVRTCCSAWRRSCSAASAWPAGAAACSGRSSASSSCGLIRADLLFLGVEPAFSTVIQGVIMVGVVMLGAYLTLRRRTA